MEAVKSKIRYWLSQFPVRAPFWLAESSFLVTSLHKEGAPTWALLSLLVRALIPSPWELEHQYRNLGLGRRGKTNIQPIQCVTEFWPMRYLEGLEKTFLIDRKRSIYTASLFTCFWTLLSNFMTFGWSHLYHVERASKMAEKSDWNRNIFEVQNWSKLESPHLWTTFYEILNILFI